MGPAPESPASKVSRLPLEGTAQGSPALRALPEKWRLGLGWVREPWQKLPELVFEATGFRSSRKPQDPTYRRTNCRQGQDYPGASGSCWVQLPRKWCPARGLGRLSGAS